MNMKYLKYIYLSVVLIMTACVGNPGEDFGEPIPPEIPDGFVLVPSGTFFKADGKATITFKVYSDKQDITADSRIYQETSSGINRMESPEFKTTEVGNYTFFATYKGMTTDKVLISAITGEFPPFPADPQPDKFSGFKHRIAAIQFTGTSCGYCPNAISAITKFKESEHAGKMLFAAVHSYSSDDPMSNDDAFALARRMSVSSYPSIILNLNSRNLLTKLTASSFYTQMVAGMESLLQEDAYCGISASVSKNEHSINLSAKVKVGKNGSYRITAWLLEDGIKAEQANQAGLNIDIKIHNNALRSASATSVATGDLLGGKETTEAGTEVEFHHEFSLDGVKNVQNCHVIVIVSRKADEYRNHVADNVINCPVDASVAFEYE